MTRAGKAMATSLCKYIQNCEYLHGPISRYFYHFAICFWQYSRLHRSRWNPVVNFLGKNFFIYLNCVHIFVVWRQQQRLVFVGSLAKWCKQFDFHIPIFEFPKEKEKKNHMKNSFWQIQREAKATILLEDAKENLIELCF